MDVIQISDGSVSSSGDYQRYYTVDGKRYHHIIDPKTLVPADYYRQVTVVTENSGDADFLSTVLFVLPLEESKALVSEFGGVEALWVMADGSTETTEGMKALLKSYRDVVR